MSPDGVESHAAFRAKYRLDFPLLADVDRKVSEQYGAWREKRNVVGAKTMGMERSTYLIDGRGRVARVWPKVKVDGHDAEVLAALG